MYSVRPHSPGATYAGLQPCPETCQRDPGHLQHRSASQSTSILAEQQRPIAHAECIISVVFVAPELPLPSRQRAAPPAPQTRANAFPTSRHPCRKCTPDPLPSARWRSDGALQARWVKLPPCLSYRCPFYALPAAPLIPGSLRQRPQLRLPCSSRHSC